MTLRSRISHLLALAALAAPIHAIQAAPGETTAVDGIAVPITASSYPVRSREGAISNDGRFVVSAVASGTSITGAPNGWSVFLTDRQTGTNTRLSASLTDGPNADAQTGAFAPSISGDGRFIAFLATPAGSSDTQAIVYDRMNSSMQVVATVTGLPIGAFGSEGSDVTAISADGRFVMFNHFQLRVIDRQTGANDLIWSHPNAYGGETFGRAAMTPNGRFVMYVSTTEQDSNYSLFSPSSGAHFGADVFVYDLWLGVKERVSVATEGDEATGEAFGGGISADGRYVAFYAKSALTAGESGTFSDVYVRDRWLGTTERVSITDSGQAANGNSANPIISASGRFVTFRSEATNLVAAGDHNSLADVYVYDRQNRSTSRVSNATDGTQSNGFSDVVASSADGNFTLFASNATTLVPSSPGTTLFVRESTHSDQPVWRSSDVDIYDDSISQATVTSFADKSADMEFYESTDDFGVAKQQLFGVFTSGAHPYAFNLINHFWSANGYYAYAGKSVIGRGGHDSETNIAAPFGQRDLQLHPPIDDHNAVAAFIVPDSGTYSVSGLGIRRLEANGQTARLRLFNAQGSLLANLQATNDRAWVRSGNTYPMGTLCAGDRIYFAVHNDGDWEWDATSISWEIKQTDTNVPAQCPAH